MTWVSQDETKREMKRKKYIKKKNEGHKKQRNVRKLYDKKKKNVEVKVIKAF